MAKKKTEKTAEKAVKKEVQAKEDGKEDRKDERTKIQASQQSELIDQRKNDKPPKNFSEEEVVDPMKEVNSLM